MNSLAKAGYRLLILGFLVCAFSACPSRSRSNGQTGNTLNSNPDSSGTPAPGQNGHGGANQNGGADWGGGTTVSADDPSLVNRILNFALKLAAEPDPYKNIYSQYWMSRGMLGPEDSIIKPLHLFPNAKSPFVFDPPIKMSVDSPELMAISKAPIVRLKTGDCLKSLGELNSDASVSKHSIDAEVCFSIGNLSRLGPGDLMRQIFSLVIHEASHMGGADEDEAQLWQRKFYDWFATRLGDTTQDSILNNQFMAVARLEGEANNAQSFVETANTDCGLHDEFQKLIGLVGAIPFANDPVAIQITYMTLKLDLVENFTGKIDAFSKKMKEAGKSNGASCAPAMSPEDLKKFVAGLASDATEIRKAFLRLHHDFLCDGNNLKSTGAFEKRCTGSI